MDFIFQSPRTFERINEGPWLDELLSETGYAKVAGIETTLLDCARYFHKAGGINGFAQIVKDLGKKANPDRLAEIATHYENSSVRRLGYMLDLAKHVLQAEALRPFVKKAKTTVMLDPSIKPLLPSLMEHFKKAPDWLLLINEPVEVEF